MAEEEKKEKKRLMDRHNNKERKKFVDWSSLGRCCTAEFSSTFTLHLNMADNTLPSKHIHPAILSYYPPVCSDLSTCISPAAAQQGGKSPVPS